MNYLANNRNASGRDRTFGLCLINGREEEMKMCLNTALRASGRNRTFDLYLIRIAFYHWTTLARKALLNWKKIFISTERTIYISDIRTAFYFTPPSAEQAELRPLAKHYNIYETIVAKFKSFAKLFLSATIDAFPFYTTYGGITWEHYEMCRYKNGRRLTKGHTRETRKENAPCGAKRSLTLTQEEVEARNHTRERRADRARQKMSTEAQERIRKERVARKRRLKMLRFASLLVAQA